MRGQKAQMEIRGVAHLVPQGELSTFTGRKIFLVKNVQPETQLSTDIQVCEPIPTNPAQLFFFSEFSENFGKFPSQFWYLPMGLAAQATAKLFSDLAACIPPQGQLMKKPQRLHPWGWLSLCFKPGKSALWQVLLGAQILARIIDKEGVLRQRSPFPLFMKDVVLNKTHCVANMKD